MNDFLTNSTQTSSQIIKSVQEIKKDLEQVIEIFYPVLYYITSNIIKRGTLFHIKEFDFNPEFIVFHPKDIKKIKEKLNYRTLKHLEEFDSLENILKNLSFKELF